MMIVSKTCDQNQNNDDDDDHSLPLVVGQHQRQKCQHQLMQQQHDSSNTIHGLGLLSLSTSRAVGLFLVAFVVGALIPIVLWDDSATQSQNNPPTTTNPNMQQQKPIWNNLRPSSSQSTSNLNESRGPKIAWRKCKYTCFKVTHHRAHRELCVPRPRHGA